jgi:hypothetical protein
MIQIRGTKEDIVNFTVHLKSYCIVGTVVEAFTNFA